MAPMQPRRRARVAVCQWLVGPLPRLALGQARRQASPDAWPSSSAWPVSEQGREGRKRESTTLTAIFLKIFK